MKPSFSTSPYKRLMDEVKDKEEEVYENFIKKVMNDTGLNRDCSIKFIQKYYNIIYKLQDNKLYAELDLKSIGELFEEDILFPWECRKQLLEKKGEDGDLK